MAAAIERAGATWCAPSPGRRAIGLGEAVETSAGDMPSKWVIHAATMELGGPPAEIIERATESTLEVADRLGAVAGAGGFGPAWALPAGRGRAADGGRGTRAPGASLERVVFTVHGDEPSGRSGGGG